VLYRRKGAALDNRFRDKHTGLRPDTEPQNGTPNESVENTQAVPLVLHVNAQGKPSGTQKN